MLGERYFNKLMKATIYGQFVAGDDLCTLRPVIKHYREQGVRSILDYAVEDDIPSGDEVCLETRQDIMILILITINTTRSKKPLDSSTSKGNYTIFKI